MLNKSLAVGIVFLFIFSTVTPLVIGYDVEIANREFMDDLAFDCYDECYSSKASYYRGHFLKNYSNDGDVELECQIDRNHADAGARGCIRGDFCKSSFSKNQPPYPGFHGGCFSCHRRGRHRSQGGEGFPGPARGE